LLLVLLGAVLLAFVFWPRTPEGPGRAVFPLPEAYSGAYSNDWGAPRTQGRHEGTDVFAPRGTPIHSVTSGTVVHTFGEDGWNTLGGYAVSIRADRDAAGLIERGDVFYYAHMDGRPSVSPGDRVEAGEKIGEVGDTGGGPPGTRGLFEPHLHLGWYDRGLFGSRAEAPSGAMNPYPLLRRIEREASAADGP
jgi:collagen type III alpha